MKNWLKKETHEIHNYESQRFIIGLTAFLLPLLVTLIYGRIISSISAYYFTISRNIFVGLLSVTGFFLFFYNGRYYYEALISKLAALCAVGTALSPTGFPSDITKNADCLKATIKEAEILHYIFSITLFAMLIFLCLCFARRARIKTDKYSNQRRTIYLICSGIMTVSLLTYPIGWLILPFSQEQLNQIHLLFFCESAALISFGTAWFTAGKPLQHWKIFRNN
ncbi:MAG: hypothetical protein PQJ59_03230 [Spirochaetales bacterium]|nr:hypothetical protein [Spirochaetales bacterium]